MSGKTLLAKLLGSAAVAAPALAVAGGKPGLTAEEQTAGTIELEGLVEKAHAEGRSEGLADGRKAERERFGAVLTGDAASDHMGLAITLLSTTDNTPEQINAALAAAGPRVQVDVLEGVSSADASASQAPVKDPIAAKTGLVDTGAPREPREGMDEKAVADLWGGALSSIGGKGGIVAGSVWDGLVPSLAN